MASLPPERRRPIEAETTAMLAEIELREVIGWLAADAAEANDPAGRAARDAGRTLEINHAQNAEDASAWLGLAEKAKSR